MPPEVWKTREFNDTLLRLFNNQDTIDWWKWCTLLFRKKGDFRIEKNYRGVIRTSNSGQDLECSNKQLYRTLDSEDS